MKTNVTRWVCKMKIISLIILLMFESIFIGILFTTEENDRKTIILCFICSVLLAIPILQILSY